ncbi:MAG: PepSY-associated TM helix domain-containing protein [Pseudomonadota bacterium]
MAWLHTWSGLVFAVLLYFIFVMGTMAYFRVEIDQWMQPERPAAAADASTAELLQQGFDYLARQAPDSSRYFVSLPLERTPGLMRVFAALDEPNAQGERFVSEQLLTATGTPLRARETGGGTALYRMHYALHYLPDQVATYVVGIGTLLMFLALVTGVVTHKKIFADFFTLRLGKGQRSWLDAHNISSVLALPFMLMITFSGLLFFTFQYSPGVMLASMGIERPAQAQMRAHLRPGFERPAAAGQGATMINIQGPLSDYLARNDGVAPRFVELAEPGDAAARYRFGATPEGVSRRGPLSQYSAVDGRWLSESETPAADAYLSEVMQALHEGRFSFYALRWLYFASGLLGCAMVGTGLMLWTKKRRALWDGRAAPLSLRVMERANLGIIVGLPLGLVSYFWANRLLPVELANRAAWELHLLFLVWLVSLVHAAARKRQLAWREQVATLALLCLSLPLLNALTSDVHLAATLAAGDTVRASFDLTALAFGFALLLVWRRLPGAALSDTGASAWSLQRASASLAQRLNL